MDEQVPVPVVLTDSATWLLVQKRDSEMMEGLRGEVDLADRNGWTCLHWASLMGKDEHVAIILDSGADWSVETTVAIQHVSGNRRAGTTPEELARYPGGVIKGHVNIVATLAMRPLSRDAPNARFPSAINTATTTVGSCRSQSHSKASVSRRCTRTKVLQSRTTNTLWTKLLVLAGMVG
eukprot:COSAG06_NODE_5757_length_3291_cov_1.286028_3_plen_179_part_00